MKTQSGFTLIELVITIVILGILAATAVPKFIDLRDDANLAAHQGIIGAIASASTVNYSARSANATKGSPTAGVDCPTAIQNILQGGVPAGYTVLPSGLLVAGDNPCNVQQDSTMNQLSVNVIGIP